MGSDKTDAQELQELLQKAIEQQSFSAPPGFDKANEWLLEAMREYRDDVSLTKLDDFNVSNSDLQIDGYIEAWEHLHHANELHLSVWDSDFMQSGAEPFWVSRCEAPRGCDEWSQGGCEFSCTYEDAASRDDAERERYGRFLNDRWAQAAQQQAVPQPWKVNANLNAVRKLFDAQPAEVLDNGITNARPALYATVHRYGSKPPSYRWSCGGEHSDESWSDAFGAMRDVEEHFDLMQDMPEDYRAESAS